IYQASFTPKAFFDVRAYGEWNPVARSEEVRAIEAGFIPFEGFRATASHMFVTGVTEAWGGTLTWALTPKWSFGVGVQYDFRIDEYISQDLVVTRDYHDFVLQGVFERDFGRDDERFYVTFVPKFLSLGSRMKAKGYGP
ncbi:MAG TPA: hypothetical protein VEJ18_03035, partial [Planctomycetota bacterium]|nr:hypothetical protein [Planctomycetota bacterium]